MCHTHDSQTPTIATFSPLFFIDIKFMSLIMLVSDNWQLYSRVKIIKRLSEGGVGWKFRNKK